MAKKESTVLIYGTSLSGYRTAYALGKMGYKCVLLNRGTYVDEYRNQLLSQLPLDFCWVCGAMPQRMFIALGTLQVFYNAKILEVTGRPGAFRVKFKKRDPLVNNFACTECEACIRACPEETEVAGEKRRAIFCLPKPGWENVFLLDKDLCTGCGRCEKVCPTGALKLDRPEEIIEIKAGAIILAPEFDEPGREDLSLFGYGRYINVVKNSDLARRSLLTNFVKSSLERPSDGAIPQKVAIIVTPQYNRAGIEYENYNCSVSAVYRAWKIRDLLPETEVVVFLREFRGFGKGHYLWYQKALDSGARILRADYLSLEETPDKGLLVSYQLGGKRDKFEADLVILITGQVPPSQMDYLSKLFGLRDDGHGFCWVEPFSAGRTNVAGVFAVGEFTGPKGNPETVWEAYGVASEVLEFLGSPNVTPPTPPKLRPVSGEEPKTGVFLCSCFGEFEKSLDLKTLAERIKNLPGVTHVEIIKACCTPATMQETASKIKDSGVNRVVLAVCTPLQKLLRFRRTVMMAGLSPLLLEILRLREDVIWVHEDGQKMLDKALALVAAGVEKVRRAQAAPPPTDSFEGRALVIGGGAAGMTAAITIAERGFPVTLVEKKEELGGLARDLPVDLEGNDLATFVKNLAKRVENHPQITLLKGAEIRDLWGYAGHFMAEVIQGEKVSQVSAGVVVVATGAKPFNPRGAFLHGNDPRVMTQRELEKALAEKRISAESLVMIQCVGSRNSARPFCSRFCCSQALKNALQLRQQGKKVTILYRDLNTYGFKEDYLHQAQEVGIAFIRFPERNYPRVKAEDEALKITVFDLSKEKEVTLSTEALVLSVGVEPDLENNRRLAELLDYHLDPEGFFETETSACPFEEAIKRLMKPFELASNGIFPVGLAHSPRSVVEAVLTAKDAAGRALVLLPKGQLPPPNAMFVSEVHQSRCVGCGLCVEVCPYRARELDPDRRVVRVRPFLCDSCGACLVACPSEAAYLRDARGEQMLPAIDALLE